jgi:hypothetical protein
LPRALRPAISFSTTWTRAYSTTYIRAHQNDRSAIKLLELRGRHRDAINPQIRDPFASPTVATDLQALSAAARKRRVWLLMGPQFPGQLSESTATSRLRAAFGPPQLMTRVGRFDVFLFERRQDYREPATADREPAEAAVFVGLTLASRHAAVWPAPELTELVRVKVPQAWRQGSHRRGTDERGQHRNGAGEGHRTTSSLRGSAFEFTEDWRRTLEALAEVTAGHLFMSRLPIVGHSPSFVTNSRMSSCLASRPTWRNSFLFRIQPRS